MKMKHDIPRGLTEIIDYNIKILFPLPNRKVDNYHDDFHWEADIEYEKKTYLRRQKY